MSNYKLVEFCCGTGGFSIGFNKTNKVDTIYANDNNEYCKKTFDLNHNIELTCKDIHEIKLKEIPKHDILTAGFQCQPFSISGKQLGFEDERSNVFFKLIKIINKFQPRVVVLENVKNLKTHDKGNTYKIIKKSLKDIGYYIKDKIINTCDLTKIPQNRERIYIVCFLNKEDFNNFEFSEDINNKNDITDYLEEEVDEKYYYDDRFKVWDVIKKSVIKENTVYQYRRNHVRENKTGVCPTLVATGGTGGHNVPLIKDKCGIRKLTPRECFNLQGFPDDFKLPDITDSHLYKQAGNAVTVKVVEKIAKKIIKALDKN